MPIAGRLQTVKKTRVYEAIVEQLTALILEGEIKTGDKLPTERELCEQFGVGRNSVREATRSLESARLVETKQGEGTFVTAHPESMIPHDFRKSLLRCGRRHGTTFSRRAWFWSLKSQAWPPSA